ncbi:MAG: DUF4145 domain-containing protein [Lachnospiraceae bacterium]|nr:DUF4145 domain-containing protein [Lachnospiraceae bacterium]
MGGFQCPYCNRIMSISNDTFRYYESNFRNISYPAKDNIEESAINIYFYKCPNCGEYIINAKGIGSKVEDVDVPIRPLSAAKQYPEYIPKSIRQDYEEACAIVKLSPKASATLSRRCLQGMIRDYWEISEKNLYEEINSLKGKIQPDLWEAIDSLRQLGNIGAHMEKDINMIVDIDEDEADNLIKLIELLMKEWYINRAERTQLFASINKTNQNKQDERKKTSTNSHN